MKMPCAHRLRVTKWRAYAGISALIALFFTCWTFTPPAHAAVRGQPAVLRPGFRPMLRAAARTVSAALPRYTVRAGDSISAVAGRFCGQARDWTGIYAASRRAHLTARNANDLRIGQQLAISCGYVPGMLGRATTPRSSPVLTSWNVSKPVYHAWSQPSTTYHGSSAMQQCIISRESGGNSQVMNSTGHYGLYQFSYDTWKASGGNPADFGHASVAEQNQAFYTAVQRRGYSDWVSYDGC